MAIVRTGPIALFRDIRLSLNSNTIIRTHARSALLTLRPEAKSIAFGLGLLIILVIFLTVSGGTSPLTSVGGIAISVVCTFCLIGSTYRSSRHMCDLEFEAVTTALSDYRKTLIARSKIMDFRDHIAADDAVQKAQRKLTETLADLRFAERHAYDAERRAMLEIPLKKNLGDDIPF